MPRIAPRIPRADVVGSLLRPRHLLDARHAWREGRLTEAEMNAAADQAVTEAVALQEEAGIDAEPVLAGTASWSAVDTNLNARIYLARSDGPFTCPDGEVVEVAAVSLAGLDEWLAGRDVCPDSVDLVVPHLPR